MSTRLYEEFLKPLLLVALFAPPEELSAGATLAAFYFYSPFCPTCHVFQLLVSYQRSPAS